MAFKLLSLLLVVFPLAAICQYRGGANDGFALTNLPKTSITDNNAFRGGANDGFALTNLPKTNITDANAFVGGSNDGFAVLNLPKTNITDASAFIGGSNDGFALTNLPKINITDASAFVGGSNDGFALTNLPRINITDANAFIGGSNDGFALTFLPKQNISDAFAFKGGIGRGETQAKLTLLTCDPNTFTWNGSVSNAWENPDNWNCGIMPHIGSTVIIPNGVPNYPRVHANFEIKTLVVNNNASIMIMTGVNFKINGQ
jgi:hypothetical protein